MIYFYAIKDRTNNYQHLQKLFFMARMFHSRYCAPITYLRGSFRNGYAPITFDDASNGLNVLMGQTGARTPTLKLIFKSFSSFRNRFAPIIHLGFIQSHIPELNLKSCQKVMLHHFLFLFQKIYSFSRNNLSVSQNNEHMKK